MICSVSLCGVRILLDRENDVDTSESRAKAHSTSSGKEVDALDLVAHSARKPFEDGKCDLSGDPVVGQINDYNAGAAFRKEMLGQIGDGRVVVRLRCGFRRSFLTQAME
jgi:hypothetical protein